MTLEEDTAPVGSFPLDLSPFGALDMAGNVSEWTDTSFKAGYRIIKGGGAYGSPASLRGANFMFGAETDADVFIGFRCAYSEDEDEPEAAEPPQLGARDGGESCKPEGLRAGCAQQLEDDAL